MADLSVKVCGLELPNPFVIGSGPPGTNANVIAKAFDEGWGGVVAKTVCLESTKIVNTTPRYARLRAGAESDGKGEIVGWENIELISDRPLEVWLDEFRAIKKRYPRRVLIASVMDEYRREAWEEIVERVQATGVDALELNLSCPHGLPERKMGAAMGQDPEIVREVCGWVKGVAKVPFLAKLTPNITHIDEAARAALKGGAEGVSAINTILSVMGVDLETLRPEPSVEGYSTPGGYSYTAVRPIALRMAMECARVIESEFPGRALSGIGGVSSGADGAQFILLGAQTVQVCTGVMIHGYGLVRELCRELAAFMDRHGFTSVEQFRGHSLKYFTTHADLVERQRRSREAERASVKGRPGGARPAGRDSDWSGDRFVQQSQDLVSNG